MSISPIGPSHSMPISGGGEKAEGPGPEHDGDSDDAGVSAPQAAPPSPGTGRAIDTKA
jgi:hypothetical protein